MKAEGFQEFWLTYPADLCGGARNKGVKGQAEKSYERHVKDHDELMHHMREQIRQDRKVADNGGKPYRWPFATTYLNQERWKVEMESTHDRLETVSSTKYCKCGHPDPRIPLGGYLAESGEVRYKERVCHVCYRRQEKENNTFLTTYLEKIGIYKDNYENIHEFRQACKSWFIAHGEKAIMGKVIK